MRRKGREETEEHRRREPAGIEARRTVLRDECACRLVRRLGEVARRGDAQPLGVADEERARRLRPAEPLLRRHGVEVEVAGSGDDCARRLSPVDEHGQPGLLPHAPQIEAASGRPEDVRRRDQARARRDSRENRVFVPLRHDDTGAGRVHCSGEAEVLLIGDDDLVFAAEAEPREDDRAAAGGRVGQGNVQRVDVQHGCEGRPGLFAELENALDPPLSAATVLEIVARLLDHGLGGGSCDRSVRTGVEVRVPVEHRELRAGFLERHPTWSSTGAWSESRRPSIRRRSSGQTTGVVDGSPRTRIWSIVGPGSEKPHSRSRS